MTAMQQEIDRHRQERNALREEQTPPQRKASQPESEAEYSKSQLEGCFREGGKSAGGDYRKLTAESP